jgi:hypothetical protein
MVTVEYKLFFFPRDVVVYGKSMILGEDRGLMRVFC